MRPPAVNAVVSGLPMIWRASGSSAPWNATELLFRQNIAVIGGWCPWRFRRLRATADVPIRLFHLFGQFVQEDISVPKNGLQLFGFALRLGQ
jgi:hypothetical protein